MARPEHLFVFAYDVEKDSARTKLATLLDERLDRVQKSVFEGRMTVAAARKLAARVGNLIGPDDSLRVYCITDAGLKGSLVKGKGQLSPPGDYWLV